MLTMLYAGPTIFGTPYSLVTEEMRSEPSNEPTQRMRHYSFLFHTFVLMNLFNMFNCRVMNCEENAPGAEAPKKDFNVFARLHKNWWFPLILLAELNIQYAIVSYPGIRSVFGICSITPVQHIVAFFLGISVLGVGALARLVNSSFTEKLPNIEKS
jgi:hypothetical protein